jgi:hypothetical protein
MKKLSEELRQKLRAPLNSDAISQHPTKTFLSTIKAIYVVERINDVFGIGGWKINNEVVLKEGKWVVVRSTFLAPEYGIEIEQFGGNDNADLGDAYKGAATDALTKIGSYLEIGIDVFKGKSTHKTKTVDNKIEKKWLNENTAEFNAVVDMLTDGRESEAREYLKGFQLSKKVSEKLTQIANNLKTA